MANAANPLLSPKIAPLVLEHLSPGPLPESDSGTCITTEERRGRQHSLAQLATVCRHISSPALDVLWRHIDDFRHLLFVIPPYDRKKGIFDDVITDADWARFQLSCRRVRALHLAEADKIHTSVWILLTRRNPHGPLLGGLERLTSFNVGSNSLCYTMFLSSSIRHLELKIEGSTEPGIVRMIVQAAQAALSSVLHLSVDDQNTPGDKPPAIAFWALPQLKTLKVAQEATLTTGMMKSLASFNNLRTLDLHIKEAPTLTDISDYKPSLISLRELTLTGPIKAICSFYTAAAPPDLDSLSINAKRLCDSKQSTKEGQNLASLSLALPPSLRRFRAVFDCSCTNKYHFPDSEKLLTPLRTAHGLQEISFLFRGGEFHLSDATLYALRDAWPGLISFEIKKSGPLPRPRERYSHDERYARRSIIVMPQLPPMSSGRDTSPPTPPPPRHVNDHSTVRTIAVFAHAHKHLTRLVLPTIDLEEHPDLSTVPLIEHGLRHFGVCALPKKEVGQLFDYAAALDMLFPTLDLSGARDAVASETQWMGGVPPGAPWPGEGSNDANLRVLLLALQAGRTGIYRAGRPRGGDPSGILMNAVGSDRGHQPEPAGVNFDWDSMSHYPDESRGPRGELRDFDQSYIPVTIRGPRSYSSDRSSPRPYHHR
ncbi:hypothetical protein C8Q78DRAFT_176267 [Trametes maxima]|nr:hypothetical protein C8Q78DRAFT_176267 [Trametes maxima]